MTDLLTQKWRVIRPDGETLCWGLTPSSDETWTIEGRPQRFRDPYLAIASLMVERGEGVREIVPPEELSAWELECDAVERCLEVIDNLWGELEAGADGNGMDVIFVVDSDGGTETYAWDADDCLDAMNGVRLAMSTIERTMNGDDESEGAGGEEQSN